MAMKAKHAFGSEQNISKALTEGKIDAYDILFLDEKKVGWINKSGEIVIAEPDLSGVEAELATKANAADVEASLLTKANASDVESLGSQIATKADATEVEELEKEVATKVDAETVQSMIEENSKSMVEVVEF